MEEEVIVWCWFLQFLSINPFVFDFQRVVQSCPPHPQLSRAQSCQMNPVCSGADRLAEMLFCPRSLWKWIHLCWSDGCYIILAEIRADTALEMAQAVKCYTFKILRLFLSRNCCKGVGERVTMTGDHRLWEACYETKWTVVSCTQLWAMLKVYNFQGMSDQERELKYFYVDEHYWSKRKMVANVYLDCSFSKKSYKNRPEIRL